MVHRQQSLLGREKKPSQPVTVSVMICLLCLIGHTLLTVPPSLAANTATAQPSTELKRLQTFLNALQTLEADFVQRVIDPEAGVPSISHGHISTAKPNRFRWDYRTPTEQIIVSDGQNIWFYEPDLEQVTLGNTKQLEDTPTVLLSSGTQLQQFFTWEIFEDASLKCPSVRLFPKKEGSIQEVALTLHPQRQELLKLTTRDSLGHTSHFSFKNMRINQPIPEKRFQFKMPSNVDIIQDYSRSSNH